MSYFNFISLNFIAKRFDIIMSKQEDCKITINGVIELRCSFFKVMAIECSYLDQWRCCSSGRTLLEY